MLGQKTKCFKPHTSLALDNLVPLDNFYRQLEARLDLSFVRELVASYYCPSNGRPSIDPVVFFKLQLVMFFEGIRSERQLMEMVNLNLAHRWYIGYDLDEAVPDHSSLSKIRDRYGLEVFQRFFENIVQRCIEAGLVWGNEVFLDGTMVRANAAYQRQVPRFYQQAHDHLQGLFPGAADAGQRGLVGKYDGTQPLVKPNAYQRPSDYWVSPVDPSATSLGHQRLGYHLYYVVDGGKARIILNCLVTPASIQDNTPMLDLTWWSRFRWRLPLKQVVADQRYGTIDNVVELERNGIRAFLPLHAEAARKRSKQDLFPASRFHYDPQQNCYRCPQGEMLHYHSTDYQGQRYNYKADARVCAACALRSQCTTSQQGRRISHSIFKTLLDQVQAYQHSHDYQKAMRKRQVWVEPKFAEIKEWHQGTKFRVRGLWKVNSEALIKAAGQNIKQLLKVKNGTTWPAPGSVLALSCRLREPGSYTLRQLRLSTLHFFNEMDHFQHMVTQARERGFEPEVVAFDSWYASLPNLKLLRDYDWHWLTQLKPNRQVSVDRSGNRAVSDLMIPVNGLMVHLKGYGWIKVFRTVVTNGDAEYWATSKLDMRIQQAADYALDAWQIEVYHRGLKQFTGIERGQFRLEIAQRNPIGLAFRAFVRLEVHRLRQHVSYFEAKTALIWDASALIWLILLLSLSQLRKSYLYVNRICTQVEHTLSQLQTIFSQTKSNLLKAKVQSDNDSIMRGHFEQKSASTMTVVFDRKSHMCVRTSRSCPHPI